MSTRKKPALPATRIGATRSDFITLDALRMGELFICWREGARMPNSFHATEEEARAMARQRVRPGETMCVLHARIATSLTASTHIAEREAPAAPEPGATQILRS
ncbi:MAG: hypothetical protein LCH38_10970 [Proteobacteria bacterium]|nr:hypothetical protein [Pseudomonadota bacterium]